jgi:hypothetical protein
MPISLRTRRPILRASRTNFGGHLSDRRGGAGIRFHQNDTTTVTAPTSSRTTTGAAPAAPMTANPLPAPESPIDARQPVSVFKQTKHSPPRRTQWQSRSPSRR